MSDVSRLGAELRRHAIENIATDPEQLANVDYMRTVELSGMKYHARVILALVKLPEMEGPQWHTEIYFQQGNRTIHPSEYNGEQKRLAWSLYRQMMGGAGKAGGENEWYHEVGFALHFVRLASEKDLRALEAFLQGQFGTRRLH